MILKLIPVRVLDLKSKTLKLIPVRVLTENFLSAIIKIEDRNILFPACRGMTTSPTYQTWELQKVNVINQKALIKCN